MLWAFMRILPAVKFSKTPVSASDIKILMNLWWWHREYLIGFKETHVYSQIFEVSTTRSMQRQLKVYIKNYHSPQFLMKVSNINKDQHIDFFIPIKALRSFNLTDMFLDSPYMSKSLKPLHRIYPFLSSIIVFWKWEKRLFPILHLVMVMKAYRKAAFWQFLYEFIDFYLIFLCTHLSSIAR